MGKREMFFSIKEISNIRLDFNTLSHPSPKKDPLNLWQCLE